MDRMVASILRPWGASFVGAFVVLCGVLHGGDALAASGTPLLQPDVPPAGAVVAPAPDPPTADAPAPVVGRAPTFRRPTLRAQSGTGGARAAVTRTKPAAAARSHARAAHASPPKRQSAARPFLRRGLPDGVAAFVAAPIIEAARDGLDRGAARARGHAARDRHARRRLPDSGRRQGCTGRDDVKALGFVVALVLASLALPASALRARRAGALLQRAARASAGSRAPARRSPSRGRHPRAPR